MAGKRQILSYLEELARQLDVRVRYEKTNARGGLCKHRGKFQIIIDPKASDDFKIDTVVQALKTFDLEGLFISPALRDLFFN